MNASFLKSALLAASLVAATAAHAQSITNGSFETPDVPSGDYDVVNYAQSGWGNTNGAFRIYDLASLAADGDQFARVLSGSALYQSFSVAAGAYSVSFFASGIGDAKLFESSDVGGLGFSFVSSAPVTSTAFNSASGWTQYSFGFNTPTANSFHLAFVAAPGGNAFIDGVSVTAVPEPETYAMMLAGLGAIGFMARRRRPS